MSIARKILMGSAGAGGDKTYVDEVFSTEVYKGTGTMSGSTDSGAKTITNSIDYSEGALTWLKQRSHNDNHQLFDTVRGDNKRLVCNENTEENTAAGDRWGLKFNSNGYTIGNAADGINVDGRTYAGWTFRKQKGFFDIVSYTGTGSAHSIAHNLGCVPGCIIIKNLGAGYNWQVYHNRMDSTNPANYSMQLDQNNARGSSTSIWNDTLPTSTHFTVGTNGDVNTNGSNFIAYLFAGGASTAATARSVSFATGSSSYLDIADHSDFTFGTDDFTIECWYKADDLSLTNNWDYIFSSGWPVQLGHTVDGANTNSRFSFYMADSNSTSSYIVSNLHTGNGSVNAGQWYHVAVTRSGSTFRIFLNGELKNTETSSGSAPAPNTNSAIGRFGPSASYYADGKISNFRYVKGTAVYTESFRPPTEPLTDITNTKLLCCNSSSVTGSTVTPGTITNNGATASTDSPFDDPSGFSFGDAGDQGIIKCGRYEGNGNDDGPEIFLGWEPSYVLIKNIDSAYDWVVFDSMRGIATGGSDPYLRPNGNNSETDADRLDLTPTGFKISANSTVTNADGDTYIFLCIRRSDGYVGKPPELGTGVFAMDTGNGSSTIPVYDSGFPVDFALYRTPASTANWWVNARLTQGYELKTNDNSAEGSYSNGTFDSNTGWNKSGANNTHQSWMWKRHAGFDVVTYTAKGGTLASYAHSLGKIPEMIWVKRRDSSQDWSVYHKGLNGGSSPEGYGMKLNTNATEASSSTRWASTAPTSTYFFAGGNAGTNQGGSTYIAMLFASVDGISKCGYYTGDGTNDGSHVITTGFQPRFIVIKVIDANEDWMTFDTVRGIAAGNDSILLLNTSNSASSGNYLNLTSSGFDLRENHSQVNGNGKKYIYYAHA